MLVVVEILEHKLMQDGMLVMNFFIYNPFMMN
jgi:hypothetical protein